MDEKVKNLFDEAGAESPQKINNEMAARLREMADDAEKGEFAGMFCVILSPALVVGTDWLGHMGTSLSLRGAIAKGVALYDHSELDGGNL